MAKFDEVYTWIAKQLAVYLDKFKVKNPVLFLVVESALFTLLNLVSGDAVNLPNITFLVNLVPELTTDNIISGILGALMVIISPRTTFLKNGGTNA